MKKINNHEKSSYFLSSNAMIYMANAFRPKSHKNKNDLSPRIKLSWPFLPDPSFGKHPIHHHSQTVRAMMAILTSQNFPVPIWKLLQIRNCIDFHKNNDDHSLQNLHAEWIETRVIDKGIEFDIKVEITNHSGLILKSVNTFYHRGRLGHNPTHEAKQSFQFKDSYPQVAKTIIQKNGIFKYCKHTGDYNGIHYIKPYAQLMGLHSSSIHPHRPLAWAWNHLDHKIPCHLEVEFKGPIYYGNEIALHSYSKDSDKMIFGVFQSNDHRPAMVGILQAL